MTRGSMTVDPSLGSVRLKVPTGAPASSRKVAVTAAEPEPRFCTDIGVFQPLRARITIGSTSCRAGSVIALFAAACGRPGGGVGTGVAVRTPVGVTVGVGEGVNVGVGRAVGVGGGDACRKLVARKASTSTKLTVDALFFWLRTVTTIRCEPSLNSPNVKGTCHTTFGA